MRITNTMLFRMALADFDDISHENARLLLESGTGRKLNKPSDNPADAVRQLRLRRGASRTQEMIDNLKAANEEVTTSELAIDDGISIFQRAQELAVEAGSGSKSANDFKAIELEANQLLHDLVLVGNRSVNGRYLFSGTDTLTAPFQMNGDPPTSVTYQGNSGTRTVRPSAGVELPVNIPGDEAFANDPFGALIALRDAAAAHDSDALRDTVGPALETAFDSLVDVRTQIGSLGGSFERTISSLQSTHTSTLAQLSGVEDADLVQSLVDLKNVQNRQQAALAAAAQVIQPSLVDYLA